MWQPTPQQLAPPAVTALVLFLFLSSQWLFDHIEPGPLRKGDAYVFCLLVLSLLVSYWRTCLKDPGQIPKDWQDQVAIKPDRNGTTSVSNRWCRRCEMFKPPRAHHCKTCKRCVVKMDHHCVWTANCVSHITIPHFIRFLFYAVVSMIYLECFLYQRVAVLWEKRNLPSYLGPSIFQLGHLFVLVGTNSFVLFMLVILLGRTLWSLAINTWTIESWEIERHHALLRRARTLDGYLHGPDGTKMRLDHQEFPWDIGIWSNICQGMGTSNIFAWLWPFARSPSISSGLAFEHNEIDDPNKPWPPPDPDRLWRAPRPPIDTASGAGFTQPWDVNNFRKRQAADLARYADADGENVVRRQPFHERLERMQRERETSLETDDDDAAGSDEDVEPEEHRGRQSKRNDRDSGGEEGWRNKEGERLADFGVDEVADFYDEDDIPLNELLRRRRAQ